MLKTNKMTCLRALGYLLMANTALVNAFLMNSQKMVAMTDAEKQSAKLEVCLAGWKKRVGERAFNEKKRKLTALAGRNRVCSAQPTMSSSKQSIASVSSSNPIQSLVPLNPYIQQYSNDPINRLIAEHNLAVYRKVLSCPEYAVCRMFRLKTMHDKPGSVTGIAKMNEDTFQRMFSFLRPVATAGDVWYSLYSLIPLGLSADSPLLGDPRLTSSVRAPTFENLGCTGASIVPFLENHRLEFIDAHANSKKLHAWQVDDHKKIDALFAMKKVTEGKLAALSIE